MNAIYPDLLGQVSGPDLRKHAGLREAWPDLAWARPVQGRLGLAWPCWALLGAAGPRPARPGCAKPRLVRPDGVLALTTSWVWTTECLVECRKEAWKHGRRT